MELADAVDIIDFTEDLAAPIKTLNYEWLENDYPFRVASFKLN